MSYTEWTHRGLERVDSSDPKMLAWLIRRHGLEMTHISRGSHIGSVFSLAEIMATLYARVLNVRPEEPNWPERDRLILSKGHAGAAVYAALAERGWQVVNMDCTVVLEQPKLRPHIDAMRGVIAGLLEVAVDAVSVKASTNEKMGFTGRGEGIMAFATVLVQRA